MADIEVKCVEAGCGSTFKLTDGEQAFYAERGFALPKRCKTCRQRRKAENNQRMTPTSREVPAFVAEPVEEVRSGRQDSRRGRDGGRRRRERYDDSY